MRPAPPIPPLARRSFAPSWSPSAEPNASGADGSGGDAAWLMLDDPADDPIGHTPLMSAAERGAADLYGNTPSSVAAKNGDLDLACALAGIALSRHEASEMLGSLDQKLADHPHVAPSQRLRI